MFYYQVEDSISKYFYIVPKSLFTNKYAALSANAKIMYMHMLERCKLSMKNKWIDEARNVFIIYPVEQLAKMMNLKKSKIHLLLNELEMYQLIKRKRTGGTYPNKIYVANLDAQVRFENEYADAKQPTDTVQNENADETLVGSYCKKENVSENQEDNDVQKCGNQRNSVHESGYKNTEVKKSDIHECGGQHTLNPENDIHESGNKEPDVHKCGGQKPEMAIENPDLEQKCDNIHKDGSDVKFDVHKYGAQTGVDMHKYGVQADIDVHEPQNLISTNADPSNNNINNNKYINACARVKEMPVTVSLKDIEAVKHQIDYSALVQQHPEHRDAIDVIVSVMVEMNIRARTTTDTVLIGEMYIPVKEVANRYAMLTVYDINHLLHAVEKKTLKNARSYFRVCLYRLKESRKAATKPQAFQNFKGRDLTATIDALERWVVNPKREFAFS